MPGALLPDDPTTPPATGTRPTSSPCSGCPPRATGTCRSRSARAQPCTSSSATRRRRCSTAPRTATARATSTRSASGPTTSRPARRRLHLRRRGPARRAQARRAFVIAGDQNSDPLDGDSIAGRDPAAARPPAREHEAHARRAPGAVEAAALQGGANLTHRSDPRFDTADFADSRAGQPARRLRAAEPADQGWRQRGVLACPVGSAVAADRGLRHRLEPRGRVPDVGSPAGLGRPGPARRALTARWHGYR